MREELAKSEGSTPTWGELIAAYRPGSRRPSEVALPVLCLDETALRTLGITPRTPLLPPGPAGQDASGLLVGSDLALVADSDEVCLTSLDAVAGWAALLSRTASANVATVAGERRCALCVRAAPRPGYLPPSGPPRRRCQPTPGAGLAKRKRWICPSTAGENVRLQVGRDESPALTIYQPRLVRLLGAVLLLATLALVSSLLRRRRAAMAVATVGCAVIVLLGPQGWVPAMRGLFWGSAIALFGSIVPRFPRRSKARPTSDSAVSVTGRLRSPASATSALLLALVLVSAAAAVGRSAETAADSATRAEPYPVLFPVGDDGQATGSYLYVPRPFYEAMYLRSAATSVSPRTWLIQSASYQVILNRDEETAESQEETVVEMVAEFDVEVFQPGTRIRLPLNLDGVRLVDTMIDGQTVQPVWQNNGQALDFDIESARALRVTLSLRPLVRTSETSQGFTVKIPPLARSRARVKTSLPVEKIEIPTARGSLTRDAMRREVTAELGPTDTLVVRWPGPGALPRESPEVDASELFLLRVQPNSVVLDGQFTFQIRRGSQRFMELWADPRLRLLPLAPGQPIVRQTIQDGPRQRIRFELNRPASGEFKIAASFLLTGTAGLGNLTAPQVEAVGNRSAPPWVGVWAAPGLDVELPPELMTSAAPVTDFLALWGSSEFPPQQVFRLPRDGQPPSLTVQPGAPNRSPADLGFVRRSGPDVGRIPCRPDDARRCLPAAARGRSGRLSGSRCSGHSRWRQPCPAVGRRRRRDVDGVLQQPPDG